MIEEVRHKTFLHKWLFPLPGQKLTFWRKLGRSFGKKIKPQFRFNSNTYTDELDFRLKLRQSCESKFIEELILKSNSCGASYFDYFIIYNYLMNLRPKVVLELGSGISTLAFAIAARDLLRIGHKTTIYSVESSSFYFNQLLLDFPIEFKKFVDFKLCDTYTADLSDMKLIFYKGLPDEKIDLVYIDGPPTEGRLCGDLVNISLRQKSSLSFLTNKRLTSVELFGRLFRNGNVSYDYFRKMGYGHNVSDVSFSFPNSKCFVDNIDLINEFKL